MKLFSKVAAIGMMCITLSSNVTSCMTTSNTEQNTIDTKTATNTLLGTQKTPTDIDYSLERYNLIKRAYWVNGQREKANAVPCGVERPIGYIVLITDNGTILDCYTVDGKVSSLNSYLSPDSEYYEVGDSVVKNNWLADVDGSYGTNTDGIFWFTMDGHYMEWKGNYLYSDIPFNVKDPVLTIKTN